MCTWRWPLCLGACTTPHRRAALPTVITTAALAAAQLQTHRRGHLIIVTCQSSSKHATTNHTNHTNRPNKKKTPIANLQNKKTQNTTTQKKDCALSVYKPNPRQYVAKIPQVRGERGGVGGSIVL